MIIQCASCLKRFIVKDKDIPEYGRNVQCGYCSVTWFQKPIIKQTKKIEENDNTSSINRIKASDGKIYKFLGAQWAQVLPSGKTGLFARKKISQELNRKAGREIKNTSGKKQLDPSSEHMSSTDQLPDIYKPEKGFGFFGYIFLLLIIGLGAIWFLKIFQNEIMNYFPQVDLVYNILDEQILLAIETIKNVMTIIRDLINSY